MKLARTAAVVGTVVTVVLLSILPAAGAGAVDRVVPTLTLASTPRYPQPGATVLLTGTVRGRYGVAHGWVRFRYDGQVICRHVPLRNGRATCTAPRSLATKRHYALGFFGSRYYRGAWLLRIIYS